MDDRLFLTRAREPAAAHEDSDKWLGNRGAGIGMREQIQGTGSAVTSGERRVESTSPASFIGGRVAEDEGIFFVGGGAAREGEPQRGEITKPRATSWVNGTQSDARALKGRNNPINPTRTACRRQLRNGGKTYFALSGLGGEDWGVI